MNRYLYIYTIFLHLHILFQLLDSYQSRQHFATIGEKTAMPMLQTAMVCQGFHGEIPLGFGLRQTWLKSGVGTSLGEILSWAKVVETSKVLLFDSSSGSRINSFKPFIYLTLSLIFQAEIVNLKLIKPCTRNQRSMWCKSSQYKTGRGVQMICLTVLQACTPYIPLPRTAAMIF